MREKKANPAGRVPGSNESLYSGENGRLSCLQDTKSTFDIQTVRRFCRDAYLILSLFPAEMRYSYYVDSKGRLRCRADRRPAA